MKMTVESVSCLAVIAVVFCAAGVVAAPYQELAPRAGHVPVYIRVGDTPLSEIHPRLAEAFNEIESASLILENAKPQVENIESLKTVESNEETIKAKEAVPEKAKTNDDEEEEVPAIVVEQLKNDAESDIASFDVVKGDNSEVEVIDKAETANSDA